MTNRIAIAALLMYLGVGIGLPGTVMLPEIGTQAFWLIIPSAILVALAEYLLLAEAFSTPPQSQLEKQPDA